MIVKYFAAWLKKNNSAFTHPLRLIERGHNAYSGDFIRLQYTGIIPDIKVLVNNSGIDIEVYYHGELFDLLIDIEIEVERLAPGRYCCRLCREYDSKNMKIYDSARQLVYDHVYGTLLKWSNENISRDNFLFLYGTEGASRCASIYSDENFTRFKKNMKGKHKLFEDLFGSVIQISSLKDFRSRG
jgi:hypothetical protein